MGNAPDTQIGSNLHEKGAIVDVDYFLRLNLRDVQRHLIDIVVGLAKVYEGGRDKSIHKFIQLKGADAVVGEFPAFITHDRDAKTVLLAQCPDIVDHLAVRLGLCKHKVRSEERRVGYEEQCGTAQK